MKVITLLGTRPELIRLSLIIPKLDALCDHIVVHTGQNYDYNLDKVFRNELNIREPDYYLDARGIFSIQLAQIMTGLEEVLIKERPDALLVLGDTNSSLGAIVAKRRGIKVFHMEAGNRCYDDHVPEEINRRIIDHASDILMPYTERSRQNLLAEGIAAARIYVTGNPINEVIDFFTSPKYVIDGDYYLVTLHRSENVDNTERLGEFLTALNSLNKEIIWPMHPHTKKRIPKDFVLGEHITIREPMGFKEFIAFERQAKCVLTDSGTVQEECAILGTPVVTLRDTTERPETLETGSNIITGSNQDKINDAIKAAMALSIGRTPLEYLVPNVSDTVVKILLGYYK
jgi:UDP-N-acetylglucosamine 2-epimerase (non-hydrolysing)